MSEFKDAEVRKQLSAMFVKLASRIEQDEMFAQWLFEGTDFLQFQKKSKRKKPSTIITQRATSTPDIYTIYSKEGAKALHDHLSTYDVVYLIEIVLENSLDPARKVRRWKTKHKIVAYMVEAIAKQMAKGKAFIDQSW